MELCFICKCNSNNEYRNICLFNLVTKTKHMTSAQEKGFQVEKLAWIILIDDTE